MTGRRRSRGHGHGNNHAVVVLDSAPPAGVFFCAECGEVLTTREHFRHHQETVHGAANLAESESDHEDDQPEAEAAAEVPAAPATAGSKRQRPRLGEENGTLPVAGTRAVYLETGGTSQPPGSKSHSKARTDSLAHDATSVVTVTSAAVAAGLHVTDAVTAAKHAVQELWVPKRKPTPGANGAKVTLLRRPAAVVDAESASSDISSAAVPQDDANVGRSSPNSAEAEAAHSGVKPLGTGSSRSAERSRRQKPKGRKHTPACSAAAALPDTDAVAAAATEASTTTCAALAVAVRTRAPAAVTAAARPRERSVASDAEQRPAAMATRSASIAVAGTVAEEQLQQRNDGRGRFQQTGNSMTAVPAATATHAAVLDVAGSSKAVNTGSVAADENTGFNRAATGASRSSYTGRGGRVRGRGRGPGTAVTAPVKVMWRPKSAGSEAQPSTSGRAAAIAGSCGSNLIVPATNGLGGLGTSTTSAGPPPPAAAASTFTRAGASRRYSGRKQAYGSVGPATAVDGSVTGSAGRPAGVNSLAAGMTGLAIA